MACARNVGSLRVAAGLLWFVMSATGFEPAWVDPRLMTISPLYPCGKPCSRGTDNETVKNLVLFSSIINGIMME